jgi:cytochrome c
MKTPVFIILAAALSFTVAFAQDTANGRKLFNDPKLGGGTEGKSCNSCHADGADLKKAASRKKFMLFESSYNSLEDVVNACIVNTMRGKALPADSVEMKDITAFIRSLKD